MVKIRVAFLLNVSSDWLGGLNYFRNLLNLISEYKEYNIEPIVFISPDCDKALLQGFPNVKYVELATLSQRKSIVLFYRKLAKRVLGFDSLLESYLKKYEIDVLSHTEYKSREGIPNIYWIPDFQHKYLAEMFTEKEITNRDKSFLKYSGLASCVLLSSYDAKNDFKKFFPEYVYKSQVFQFISLIKKKSYNQCELHQKYGIDGQYFYIPNQFWKHKNHKIALDALNILKKKYPDMKVYCSGSLHDYRNPNYIDELFQYRKKYGLENAFITLGKIPYADVVALMQDCKALINPSIFEGWNTMVEEGKSLGKKMILSDLEVHKEQNALGAIYYDRHSADSLAAAMEEVWLADDRLVDDLVVKSEKLLSIRKENAIKKYRNILDFVCTSASKELCQ